MEIPDSSTVDMPTTTQSVDNNPLTTGFCNENSISMHARVIPMCIIPLPIRREKNAHYIIHGSCHEPGEKLQTSLATVLGVLHDHACVGVMLTMTTGL